MILSLASALLFLTEVFRLCTSSLSVLPWNGVSRIETNLYIIITVCLRDW